MAISFSTVQVRFAQLGNRGDTFRIKPCHWHILVGSIHTCISYVYPDIVFWWSVSTHWAWERAWERMTYDQWVYMASRNLSEVWSWYNLRKTIKVSSKATKRKVRPYLCQIDHYTFPYIGELTKDVILEAIVMIQDWASIGGERGGSRYTNREAIETLHLLLVCFWQIDLEYQDLECV